VTLPRSVSRRGTCPPTRTCFRWPRRHGARCVAGPRRAASGASDCRWKVVICLAGKRRVYQGGCRVRGSLASFAVSRLAGRCLGGLLGECCVHLLGGLVSGHRGCVHPAARPKVVPGQVYASCPARIFGWGPDLGVSAAVPAFGLELSRVIFTLSLSNRPFRARAAGRAVPS
jgi:hypothetical protein